MGVAGTATGAEEVTGAFSVTKPPFGCSSHQT